MKKSLLLFLVTGFILSQNPIERERSLFYRNVELYKKSDYAGAEKNFQIVVERLPNSIFFTSNYLMLIKSKYKLGRYEEVYHLGQNFLVRFPESRYRSEVMNTIGNCYYRQNSFEEAARYWAAAVDHAPDMEQINQIRPKLEGILKYKLLKNKEESIFNEFSDSDAGVLLAIISAENLIESGEYNNAEEILAETLNTHRNSRLRDEATQLKARIERERSGILRFALLLPLSGEFADIGNEIKDGIERGIQLYNLDHAMKIELISKDYKNDLYLAVKELRTLAHDKSVLAVIGPLDNTSAITCAAIADYEKIPVLSPTATHNQLTQIGNYFFQLNIPLDIQAESLARYALDSLKLKRFAALAPIDNEGHFSTLVEKFTDIVQQAGAEMVATEWYYPEESDYSIQLMKIKRLGLKLEFCDSLQQENPLFTQEELDSLYALEQKNDKEYMRENNIKIDSVDIPVTSIDGLFVPIYKEDLQTIVSHIAQKNIQTYLLGNGDWDDLEVLKKIRSNISGLSFIKDGYLDENSQSFKNFRNDYRIAMKKSPTIYNIIGYDVINYLLKVVGNFSEGLTRSKYFEQLHQTRNYDGIYRDIRMNSEGENTDAKLVKYQYGQMILISK